MGFLLFFVDGVGIGEEDAARNPFWHARVPALVSLLGGVPYLGNEVRGTAWASLARTDARLGVAGLPQSGTGQTTIFTGVNAAAAIGEHYGPYPNEALREVLAHNNVFHQLRAGGRRVAFANAYPPVFFERLGRAKARRTASMQAALAAGVRLRDVHDLAAGQAVSGFSVTNAAWRERGVDVPLITRVEAGRRLGRIAREHDFTAFEYSLTDMAGHKADRSWMVDVIEELDALLEGLAEEVGKEAGLTALLTSDHGNVEDWTAKGHTLNPVPTIVLGARHAEIAAEIGSLTDVTPVVALAVLGEAPVRGRG